MHTPGGLGEPDEGGDRGRLPRARLLVQLLRGDFSGTSPTMLEKKDGQEIVVMKRHGFQKP